MNLRAPVLSSLLCTSVVLVLAGCASEPPPPPPDPDLLVPPQQKSEVDEALAHLNNDSATERWREHLVTSAQASPEALGYAVRHTRKAVSDSYARQGQGAGVLRPEGRRRAFEAVGRFGDAPEHRALLKMGLDDALDIRVAAAAGLAAWGDEEAAPVLVKSVQEAPAGSTIQQAALQGLRRLATPARKDMLLNALGAQGRDVLRPVLLAAFPTATAERAAALREVASTHPSPYARAFALEVLVDDKDPAVADLARRALEQGQPALRPAALAALGAGGGDAAAADLAKVLATDPADAPDVARGLYRTGTRSAVTAACELLADERRKPATRAAVCREVLGRLTEPGAPEEYKQADTLEPARQALRAAIEAKTGPVVVAAVEALGAIGEAGTDVEELLVLLRAPDAKVAPAVVKALGRLGGEYAAQKLIELVASDAALRDAAAKSLGGFAKPRDVPVDDVIDLMASPELPVRVAALEALRTLAGSTDSLGYDPNGAESARNHGIARWREWWAARRNR